MPGRGFQTARVARTRCLAGAGVLVVLAGGCTGGGVHAPGGPWVVVGQRGMVASDSAHASQAGAEILRELIPTERVDVWPALPPAPEESGHAEVLEGVLDRTEREADVARRQVARRETVLLGSQEDAHDLRLCSHT